MLTIDAKIVNQGNEQIDIQVTITAPVGSPGIDSVTVTALDKSVLDQKNPADCPGTYTFTVIAIPFAALPAYIEAAECQAGVDQGQAIQNKTFTGALFGPVVGILPCKAPGQNRNNPVCIKLQNAIQALRNTILTQCADADNIRNEVKLEWQLAGAAAALAVILLIGAAQAPWPLNLIAGILAAAFFVAFIVASTLAQVRQKALDKLLVQMAVERFNLSDLISRLSDVCCPEFITVPRDVPLCP
ncbi:MAG TPA: hypothetical protein VEU62_09840 [Bryobacterales bacterium]|nr:hypothetical protein [Bryobacterales bacterium]